MSILPELLSEVALGSARFHHVGVVVESIERAASFWAAQLGVLPRSPVVHDPIQKVNVQFLAAKGDRTSVELIEPAAPDSPVLNALRQGGGMNHICFEVENIEEHISAARNNGGIVVVPPVQATAFENRRIAFVYYRGIGLVEFLQAENRNQSLVAQVGSI